MQPTPTSPVNILTISLVLGVSVLVISFVVGFYCTDTAGFVERLKRFEAVTEAIFGVLGKAFFLFVGFVATVVVLWNAFCKAR